MGVYSAIDCTEVSGTRNEQATIEGGWSASVQLKVTNANKEALINDLLTYQRDYPNLLTAYKPRAFSAAAKPFSSNTPAVGQAYVYDHYLVDVQYASDPERTLVSESIEPTVEFIRLDHRHFRWTSGAPLTEGEAPGVLRPELKLVRKYFNKLLVPNEVITKPGHVHNQPYTSPLLGITFPAGTLMLAPEPVDRTITTAGSQGFNYTISLLYKPNGWNKYWRPQTQAWEAIQLPDGTPYLNYPSSNLSAVLA